MVDVVHGNFDYPTSIAGGTSLHILQSQVAHGVPMVSPCPAHLHAAKAIGRGFWSHVHDSTAQRQKQNGLIGGSVGYLTKTSMKSAGPFWIFLEPSQSSVVFVVSCSCSSMFPHMFSFK